MDIPDSLNSQLNSFRRQLREKRAEQQKYYDIASDIDEVYQRLVRDKRIISGYRDTIRSFVGEDYDSFRGYQQSKVYKPKAQELVKAYTTVIKNIDSNMDKLNTLKASYENKAYQLNGSIGYLQSMVNSLVHSIENLIN